MYMGFFLIFFTKYGRNMGGMKVKKYVTKSVLSLNGNADYFYTSLSNFFDFFIFANMFSIVFFLFSPKATCALAGCSILVTVSFSFFLDDSTNSVATLISTISFLSMASLRLLVASFNILWAIFISSSTYKKHFKLIDSCPARELETGVLTHIILL